MSNIQSLQTLATAWGKESAKRSGTTCKWVRMHAEGDQMKQYKKYKIACKTTNVRYEPHTSKIPLPDRVMTSSFKNNGDGEGQVEFNESASTESSFTWSITEGLELGIETSATVGVPLVAAATVKLSSKVSFSSTQAQTKTETHSWAIKRMCTVPARTTADFVWTIKLSQIECTFHGDIEITGYFALWHKDKVDYGYGQGKHWLYFTEIQNAFKEMKRWGLSVPPQYTIHRDKVVFRATGVTSGSAGVSDVFTVEGRDIGGAGPSADSFRLLETKALYIPAEVDTPHP